MDNRPNRDKEYPRSQPVTEESLPDAAKNIGLQLEGWDNIEDKPTVFPPESHDHKEDHYTKEEINIAMSLAKKLMRAKCLMRVHLNAEQTNLTHADWTTIAFDTVDYDVGGNFNSTSDAFVAPWPGYFSFFALAELNDLAIGWQKYGIRLYKNGATVLALKEYDRTFDATARELSADIQDRPFLEKDDTVVVQVKNDFAAADTMDITGDTAKTFFIVKAEAI